MTLPEYTRELLYRYNCIIIPEFGAFLAQRIPASLIEDKQLLYPPTKEISFNNQITTNDGLLANYIAKNEGVSFESANHKIKQFVQEVTNKLDLNCEVSFSELGNFNKDEENNLIFEPKYTINYLAESFGLNSLTANQINSENEVIAITSKEASSTLNKGSYLLKYAAVGVLLLGISGIALNSHKKSVDNYNTSQYVEAQNEVNKHLQSASFVLDVKEILPTLLVEVKQPHTDEAEVTNFHVIAGAFRNYNNASKKLTSLINEGYKASYIGENKYGLHQIAYQSFSEEDAAINYLNRLKKTKNPSAWLLISNK